jgi:hypothetical protein
MLQTNSGRTPNLWATLPSNYYSRRVQQPVRVFHDKARSKYRLCPIPEDVSPDTSTYGRFCFTRGMVHRNHFEWYRSDTFIDQSTPVKVSDEDPTVGEGGCRIPRPRNCWLLYRQSKSQEITKKVEGITASELCRYIVLESWTTLTYTERE